MHWFKDQARSFSRYESLQPTGGVKTEAAKVRKSDDPAPRHNGEVPSKVAALAGSEAASSAAHCYNYD